MTGSLERWVANGWVTARRTPVKNRDLWARLLELVEEYEDDLGVSVDFWLVPRADNEDADELANVGLGCGITYGPDGLQLC